MVYEISGPPRDKEQWAPLGVLFLLGQKKHQNRVAAYERASFGKQT